MDRADAGHRPTVALRAWQRAPSGPLLPEGTLTLQASLGAQEDQRSGRPTILSQRRESLFIQRSAVFESWVPQFTRHCNCTGAHLSGLQRSPCLYKNKPLEAKQCHPLPPTTELPSHVLNPEVNCWFCGCPGASAAPLSGQCLSGH